MRAIAVYNRRGDIGGGGGLRVRCCLVGFGEEVQNRQGARSKVLKVRGAESMGYL